MVAPLPFELQVLEAMLKDISSLAEQLTKDLEAVAHPALDALTKSVGPVSIPLSLHPFLASSLTNRSQEVKECCFSCWFDGLALV